MGYNLLKNGVYWGYNPLILTVDPNFLGHPSMEFPLLRKTAQSLDKAVPGPQLSEDEVKGCLEDHPS